MLENMTSLTRPFFRDVCQATHQEGTYPTIYSNVFDLENNQIDIYHYYNYNTVRTFNLTDELAMGTHSYYLPGLFEPASNHPPEKPAKPSGPPIGRTGVEYTFTSSSLDVEDDIIYYQFDWGDATTSPWLKQQSNGNGRATHRWTSKGIYEICVKAKDIYGQESDWSDPLPLQIPKSYAIPSSQILNTIIGWLTLFIHKFIIFHISI
jgi:hypothetical protein